MKPSLVALILTAGFLASGSAFAQAPVGAPAGSTGLCNDGTYTKNATKSGACSGHKGVRDWFAAAAPAAAPTATVGAPVATPAPAPAATKAPKPAAKAPAPQIAQAPGGGPGLVWVNTPSKVYHCPGSKYYGKTKKGEYLSEAAAKAAGNHPDHGKACS
jgi:hypothetical protein